MDLINRDSALSAIGEAKVIWDAKERIEKLPSVEPLSDVDYNELNDRFGEYVVFVVRDMISGEGRRWEKIEEDY